MKPGFNLTNNFEFIQIDDQEERNKMEMKNFQLSSEHILPLSALQAKFRY